MKMIKNLCEHTQHTRTIVYICDMEGYAIAIAYGNIMKYVNYYYYL